MPGLLPDVDPDGLLEYWWFYTDRALNHMSKKFQCATSSGAGLNQARFGDRCAGSGSFGMESVARQFATGKRVLVIRNGWFSLPLDADLRDGRHPSLEHRC